MSEVGRAIEPSDRDKILRTLTEWSHSKSFLSLRTAAIVLTAWGSALRLSELLALNLDQLLEDPKGETLGRLRGTVYVRAEQSKGRRKGAARWNSAGSIVLTKRSRQALRAYLLEAIRRGWLTLPAPEGTPVFLAIKLGKPRRDGTRPANHSRLGKRATQHSWTQLQIRAGVMDVYRYHDLRHDALTRIGHVSGGNVFKVAQFGRLKDIRTAGRYVHGSIATLTELAELGDRA